MGDLSNNIYYAFNEQFNTIHEMDEILNNAIVVNNAMNQSFEEDENKYKYVLSSEGKEELLKCKYNKHGDHLNEICPITQEEFTLDNDIIMLPCKHCFDPEAITNWLEKESAVCPVCRYKLQNKEVENPIHTTPAPIRTIPPPNNHSPIDQSHIDLLNNPFAQIFQQMQENNNITQLSNDNTYGSRLMHEIFIMINHEDDLLQAIQQSLRDNNE